MNIEKRLDRLERQNQRLRRGMTGILAAGLSLLVMGQTLPGKVLDVVRAKRIEIIGADGRKMAAIGSDQNSGWILVNGNHSAPVAYIGTNDGGYGLIRTHNPKGKSVIDLTATPREGGTIITYGSGGKKLVKIASAGRGYGYVSTYSPKGMELVSISSGGDGSGLISTFNPKGKMLVKISSVPGSRGGIVITDSDEVGLIGMMSDRNGEGRVVQFNRSGDVTAVWPPLK